MRPRRVRTVHRMSRTGRVADRGPGPRTVVAGAIAVVLWALAASCAGSAAVPGRGSAPGSVPGPSSSSAPIGDIPAGDARARLAALVIDDHPAPEGEYRRSDWPTWLDIDGDGCDARSQALIAQSTTKAQVSFPGCQVVAGDWVSPYDGVSTDVPGDLDADHMVPLENVWQSGGWRWEAAERRAYANDQAVLVMVTAHANRSKGAKTPAEWRPPLESDWCGYARTWVSLKVTWHLSATTRERDALGQMLDSCPST